MKERKSLVASSETLSVRRQCELLEISRSSLYYKPLGESSSNLELMSTMDKLFLDDPTLGVRGMQDELKLKKMVHSENKIRRLMRKMGLNAISPKKNLSRLGLAKYVHPYLLRGLKIDRPNQVWAIDVTYIPMKQGFMYLTAIIDLYSRYIVGWQISNSLEKETQTEIVENAICQYGKPEIINSDQGSQYTCEHWVEFLKKKKIQISMDGKGRATDNAFIERWFRTLKQRHIYLYPAKNGLELYKGVSSFVKRYNSKPHQGINSYRPDQMYLNAA
jgi:putative transposase